MTQSKTIKTPLGFDTGVTVICGDASQQLVLLPNESVDCCVTSPPYDNLRTCYHGNFRFEVVARRLAHAMKPGGVICWNVGSQMIKGSESLTPFKQVIYFVEWCGLLLHDTMIYQKLNFSHPEKSRYHQVFEYVFILSKGTPKTFNPIMDRPNKTAGKIGNLGVNTFTNADGSKGIRRKRITSKMGMRHNIWLGKTRGQEDMCKQLHHPAMMPKWLARDLILSWSNPGDTVLDPFAGSGTTGAVAMKNNRKAILIEINPAYIPLIEKRLQ
jgi:DNA modification methylase